MPVELLLAYNRSIKNPNQIFVGQQIYIPNIEDVPKSKFVFPTVDANDVIAKARSAINKGIRYKLGSGGMNPKLALPSSNKLCDCSAFVCWVLGISRKTEIPYYSKFGGWIYTDSMVADVHSNVGIFEKISVPEVGCIVVYGAGDKIGHVGIVSKVVDGQMRKVVHCSAGNDKHFKDSIQETRANVFERADTVWGRYVG
jgi:hypothetical protein